MSRKLFGTDGASVILHIHIDKYKHDMYIDRLIGTYVCKNARVLSMPTN